MSTWKMLRKYDKDALCQGYWLIYGLRLLHNPVFELSPTARLGVRMNMVGRASPRQLPVCPFLSLRTDRRCRLPHILFTQSNIRRWNS